jgi:hypothetical protein
MKNRINYPEDVIFCVLHVSFLKTNFEKSDHYLFNKHDFVSKAKGFRKPFFKIKTIKVIAGQSTSNSMITSQITTNTQNILTLLSEQKCNTSSLYDAFENMNNY